jgi:hypothetical protein
MGDVVKHDQERIGAGKVDGEEGREDASVVRMLPLPVSPLALRSPLRRLIDDDDDDDREDKPVEKEDKKEAGERWLSDDSSTPKHDDDDDDGDKDKE